MNQRYAMPYWGLGSTAPFFHWTGLRAAASDSAQNRLRQARTSPSRVCTPRKSLVPVISSALASSPAMNSSFTASRVQP